MSAELPLFRRYPGLCALPRFPCITTPTAVEPLRLPGAPEGGIFVKRDDRSASLYGGNKPRKLEFLIGEALARRARRLVTSGGTGTHHGLATALLARQAALPTTLVLVEQPRTDHVRAQWQRLTHSGAEILRTRSLAGAAAALGWVLARSRLRGERPMWIPVGGSSPVGTLGFVSAAVELSEQILSGQAPPIREIFVAVGSGGTLAGLVLGAKLVALPVRITGVLVTDRLAPNPRRLARLARATLVLLRGVDPSVPEVSLAASDFQLTRAQLGPGYGVPTPAAHQALDAAATAGIELEATYTAKCLAELLARCSQRRIDTPALFWNTVDSMAPSLQGTSSAA